MSTPNAQVDVEAFRRVAVIGTGLIGGSLCRGLRESRPATEVIGWDSDAGALELGAQLGAFAPASSASEAVAGADLVVIATPVDITPQVCEQVEARLARGAVVTDVGSAKRLVVGACEGILGSRFVGSHPMAGSERRGIEAADPELFQDASWILTPTARTSSEAYRRVTALATSLGARPVALDPEEHDRLLARISHLPQVTATALVTAAADAEHKESLLGLAARGFRDVTRIAASDPGLWVSILRANSQAVVQALRELTDTLSAISSSIEAEAWGELEGLFARARSARLELFGKPELRQLPVTLSIPVLDRPGVLAEVTTVAGGLGANIEDLQILHSTEGGRGRLQLIVAGEEPAAELRAALESRGYHVGWGVPE